MDQISLFELTLPSFKVDKPIRLIELFAGVGSQAMALRNLGADFEHYRAIEFDKYPMASYNAIHGTNFEIKDITEVKGVDLGIENVERFTYLLTYLLIPLSRFINRRKTSRNGKGNGYAFRVALGS